MLTHEEREIAELAVARAIAKVNQPRAVLVSMGRLHGLHSGSTDVDGVSIQGRSTAVVNVGTQITAILDHLNVNAKALRQEIPV